MDMVARGGLSSRVSGYHCSSLRILVCVGVEECGGCATHTHSCLAPHELCRPPCTVHLISTRNTNGPPDTTHTLVIPHTQCLQEKGLCTGQACAGWVALLLLIVESSLLKCDQARLLLSSTFCLNPSRIFPLLVDLACGVQASAQSVGVSPPVSAPAIEGDCFQEALSPQPS